MSAIDRTASFAQSRVGATAVGLWAVAEAIIFPIVPDVGLGILVLAAPRSLPRLAFAAIAGAIVGTLALYVAALLYPDTVAGILGALPGIHPAMIADAHSLVASGQPMSLAAFGPGTPLKVYTYAWATGPQSLPALLAAVVINRVTRIGPGVVVIALVGFVAPLLVRRHERLVLAAYVLFWIAEYAIYWA